MPGIYDAVIKIGTDVKDATAGLQKLTKTVNAVVSAYAITQIAQFTYNIALAADEAKRTDSAFKKMSERVKTDSNAMLNEMENATGRMIEDDRLRQAAIKGWVKGFSSKEIVEMMRLAKNYALSTGEDIDGVLNDLFDGTARSAVMALKKMGINTSDEMGKLKINLDEIIDRTNDLAKGIGSDAENSVYAQTKRLKKEWSELKEQMGAIVTGPVSSTLEGLVNILKFFTSEKPKKIPSDQEWVPGIGLVSKSSIWSPKGKYVGTQGKAPGNERLPGGLTEEQKKAIEEQIKKFNKELQEARDEANRIEYDNDKRFFQYQLEQEEKQTEENKKIWQKELENKQSIDQMMIDSEKKISDDAQAAWDAVYGPEAQAREKDALDQKKDAWMDYYSTILGGASNLSSALGALSSAIADRELRDLDKRKMSQRAYAKEKERIEKEAEERSKQLARANQIIAIGETIINIQKAMSKAHGALPPPWNWIEAGLIAAEGAVEVATIQAQHFAKGTKYAPGGRALVGEEGPEMVELPRGSKVMTAAETRNITNNANMQYHFHGLATEQIITILKDSKRRNQSGTLI